MTKVSSKKSTLKKTSSKGKSLSLLESVYTHDKLIEIAAYYLKNSVGLKPIEQTFRLKKNKGFEAQAILKALGIDTSGKFKGILISTNIDDAITNATGLLKETLEEIKRRGL